MSGPALSVEDIALRFEGAGAAALDGVTLEVPSGGILGLLGPSGAGKTTLLRLLAGLERADRGRIRIGDRCVEGDGVHVPPERRGVGLVFQDGALFPHLDLGRNIGFGLRGRPPEERRRLVAEALDLCGLAALERRFPHELSGGERQRGALARAIAGGAGLVLLDEPLSSLEPSLRADLAEELRRLLRAAGRTAVVVTHGHAEAFAMADHVGVLRAGRLEQLGTALELLSRPASRFVAEFLGPHNLLPARPDEGALSTEIGPLPGAWAFGGEAGLALVWPGDLLAEPDPAGPARLERVRPDAAAPLALARLPSGLDVWCLLAPRAGVAVGDRLRLTLRAGAGHEKASRGAPSASPPSSVDDER